MQIIPKILPYIIAQLGKLGNLGNNKDVSLNSTEKCIKYIWNNEKNFQYLYDQYYEPFIGATYRLCAEVSKKQSPGQGCVSLY